jgi:pyruvate/2-oxoacid:ferredoxin oxidoreductase beta subunit
MMDEEILEEFLNNAVEKAKEEIKNTGKLSVENAVPLMLKNQYNHIRHLENHIKHLEENMVTKEEFKAFKEEFKAFKEEFKVFKNSFWWGISIAVAFLTTVMTLLTLFVK